MKLLTLFKKTQREKPWRRSPLNLSSEVCLKTWPILKFFLWSLVCYFAKNGDFSKLLERFLFFALSCVFFYSTNLGYLSFRSIVTRLLYDFYFLYFYLSEVCLKIWPFSLRFLFRSTNLGYLAPWQSLVSISRADAFQ